jgi:SAM-dependent methyltransferase
MHGLRRSLRLVGGPTRTHGNAERAVVLQAALEATGREPDDGLTHGFHAYPARMHPSVARLVLADVQGGKRGRKDRLRVLDPFCGSGTVLIESMLAGAIATGVDLNPVALEVAAVKCDRRSNVERDRFEASVYAVAEASSARVEARRKARAPLSVEERRAWAPHVLLELAGLYEEIKQIAQPADRRALLVLLSAIVVKFSKRRADTSRAEIDKRIGKGVPTNFFARKGFELVQRWAALDEACSRAGRVTQPRLHEADTCELATALRRPKGPPPQFDLVLTSPPYGGTYDYAEHHALRYAWLGVSDLRLRKHELGARRRLAHGSGAAKQWDDEVRAMLRSIGKVLAPGGACVLLVGDGQVGGQRVRADLQFGRLAPEAGLRMRAGAAQPRPDWGGGSPREEHLLWLDAAVR